MLSATAYAGGDPVPTLSTDRIPRLGTAPHSPESHFGPSASQISKTAINSGFVVNPANREESRLFFNEIFLTTANVPIEWTGDFDAGIPGTTSTAFKDANLARINFFRAMAGVPATIQFDDNLSRKCEESALMMSVNRNLSHNPPPTWKFYTADGAEAAANGNLALGSFGAEAIQGLMKDNGPGNAPLGHRRWMLYPQTKTMGTGDVPQQGEYNAAHVSWVFDDNFGTPRPPVREDFVAWPPKGYVPYQVVYPRWSISYPDADFTSATVTMTSDGASIPVQLEPIVIGYGESTLAWIPNGLNADDFGTEFTSRPDHDTTYNVTVANVKIGNETRTFTYDVVVFDPEIFGADTILPTVLNTDELQVGKSNVINFTRPPRVQSYLWTVSQLQPATIVEGAEAGGDGLTINATAGYDVLESELASTGNFAFHLAHPEFVDQTVQLNHFFLFNSQSRVTFSSRLGFATDAQVARVQVSLNDGLTWHDTFSQPGTGGRGETEFRTVQVDLSSFTNRPALVRFAYTFSAPNLGYNQTQLGVGWYFDDIKFFDTEEITSTQTNMLASAADAVFTPERPGDYLFEFRPSYYSRFTEVGPLKLLTASNTPIVETPPRLGEVELTSDGLRRFSVHGNAASSYQVQSSPDLNNWTTITNLTGSNGIWTVTDTSKASTRFYRVVRF